MNIVVTAADHACGGTVARLLTKEHEVVGTGLGAEPAEEFGDLSYRQADLRDPEQVAALLKGAQAVVHVLPCVAEQGEGAQAEQELLDLVARSTYVLIMGGREAGVQRTVVLSTMALMEAYPEDYAVRPDWNPRPRPEASSLAPYMAELVGREIARTGRSAVVCLRLGELGAEGGTSHEDALQAIEEALAADSLHRGYAWELRHVVSGGRFAPRK